MISQESIKHQPSSAEDPPNLAPHIKGIERQDFSLQRALIGPPFEQR
jgi:hypothetical protein